MKRILRPVNDSAAQRLIVSLIVGAGATVAALAQGMGLVAYLIGWDAAVAVFVVWVWAICWRMDHKRTSKYALREDPSDVATSMILISASIASLVGVVLAVIESRTATFAPESIFFACVSVLSVVLAWLLIHTIFTLRYAKLYYLPGNNADILFSNEHRPSYVEFAYFAFTIGMTFQVTDTFLRGTRIRKVVLQHAMISYLFNTVIIATTINLIAGFGS